VTHRLLQPSGWPRPRGYANGISARGRMVFVAGQIGWDEHGRLAGKDLVSQARQALRNIATILAEDGGRPEHLVRLTWFVVDRDEYLASAAALGEAYRGVVGAHYPAMSVVEVGALMEAGAVVEIEATAMVPDPAEAA
jgi:enamine deaminase RidA (YjgF/YER057c/UK114 family)